MRNTRRMGESPANVSADTFESWNDAVRRAERGETVAVVAHGEHVADVVPSGELERLRETIEVLSDHDVMRAVQEGLADLRAGHVVSADDVAADLRHRASHE
jgi:PHD/YefM family antitoxin component YafN of YafNO toxin-antitoxin module